MRTVFFKQAKTQLFFPIILFFQKIIALKVIFLHRRVKISAINKSNKLFLLKVRYNFFFLNSLLNFKIILRTANFLKIAKLLSFTFCFLSFDPTYQKLIKFISNLANAFCISGQWFNGFFSRFMHERLLILKSLIKLNKHFYFFPDVAVFVGNFKGIWNPLHELFIFNIPTISLTNLYFPYIKTNYFLVVDLFHIKFVYFYLRLIICLLQFNFNKND